MFLRNDQWYCTGIVSIAKMKCFVLYNERFLTSCERVLICSSMLQEFFVRFDNLIEERFIFCLTMQLKIGL